VKKKRKNKKKKKKKKKKTKQKTPPQKSQTKNRVYSKILNQSPQIRPKKGEKGKNRTNR